VSTEYSKTFPPISKTFDTLKRLCFEQRSGTLYMRTDQGHGATITLSKGNIIEVFHMMQGSMKAVQLLREVKSAYFFFKSDLTKRDDPKVYFERLPSNEVILSELSKPIGNMQDGIAAASAQRAKRILVVEDSGMARKVVVSTLVKEGYSTFEAVDGLEAVNMVDEVKPDLVLLDLILPKMDGYAVLEVIRKNEKYKNLPVIALTSRDALFDKLKGKMRGTDEYLTKPVKPEELLEKVKKHLAREE
jgi:CheY-like chemotaxis protein